MRRVHDVDADLGAERRLRADDLRDAGAELEIVRHWTARVARAGDERVAHRGLRERRVALEEQRREPRDVRRRHRRADGDGVGVVDDVARRLRVGAAAGIEQAARRDARIRGGGHRRGDERARRADLRLRGAAGGWPRRAEVRGAVGDGRPRAVEVVERDRRALVRLPLDAVDRGADADDRRARRGDGDRPLFQAALELRADGTLGSMSPADVTQSSAMPWPSSVIANSL